MLRYAISLFVLLSACSNPGRLYGRITLFGIGDASAVTVTATGPTSASVSADASGSYEIPGLTDGDYVVVASDIWTKEKTQIQVATVQSGTGTVPPILLTPVGKVSGVVLGSLPNIAVSILGTSAATLIDDDGKYHFDEVELGSKTILASSGALSASAKVDVVYHSVTVAPELTLTPTPPAPGSITGTARLEGIANAQGIIVTAIGPTSRATATDASGVYTLPNLPAGNYAVTFGAKSTLEGTISTTSMVATSSLTLAPVVFHPAGRVTGIATLQTASTGNAGIAVTAAGTSSVVFTDDTGHYALDHVPLGTIVVSASHIGYDVAQASVSVTYDATAAAQDLRLSPSVTNQGIVSGAAKLIDQTDRAGIIVSVAGTTLTATTAVDGSYTITSVPAGIHTLAFDKGAYHEKVPNVIVLSGGSFLANAGGLGPIPTIELPHAVRIFDGPNLYHSSLSEDRSTVLTYDDTSRGYAIPLDGSNKTALGIFQPLLSADGSSILGMKPISGSPLLSDVFLANTAGPTEMKLLSSASVCVPNSPVTLLLCTEPGGIGVARSDGTAAHLATPDLSPPYGSFKISPDGLTIAYLSTTYEIRSITVATGVEIVLVPAMTAPAWLAVPAEFFFTPSSATLLYRDRLNHAYAVPVAGGPPIDLSTDLATTNNASPFHLLSDPHRVAIAGTSKLNVLDFTNGAMLGSDELSEFSVIVASTNGKYLLYETDTALRTLDRTTFAMNTIDTGQAGRAIMVSPDSTAVLFAHGFQPLSVAPITGGTAKTSVVCKYSDPGNPPLQASFAGDASHVFCIDPSSNLQVEDLRTGTATMLAPTIYGLSVSPDISRAWTLSSDGIGRSHDGINATSLALIRNPDPMSGQWIDSRTRLATILAGVYAYQNGIYVVTTP